MIDYSKNIVIMSDDINTSPILKKVNRSPEDWNLVPKMHKEYGSSSMAGDLNPPGFLPLCMGVAEDEQTIKDSEKLKMSDVYGDYKSALRFLYLQGFRTHSRMAFFKLPPAGGVGFHTDEGEYYKTKDRYHLCIQGEYNYRVGEDTFLIKPGMFFWFDNKQTHGSLVTSDDDRITLVWDAPHNPENPQHRANIKKSNKIANRIKVDNFW